MTSSQRDEAYSGRRLNRALKHFAVGRTIGLAIGLLWLLLLVRALDANDYAIYIALNGLLEIGVLGSSVGLIAALERYVPTLRIQWGPPAVYLFVRRLVVLRLAATLLFCAALLTGSTLIGRLIGSPEVGNVLPLFCLIFFCEATCRFFETGFDSVLEQKRSQLSLLWRNCLRVLALIGASVLLDGEVTLRGWLLVEGACSVASLLFTTTLFLAGQHQVGSATVAEGVNPFVFDWSRIRRYSAPVYVAQFVGMLWGLEAAKVIGAKVLDGELAAKFAFCIALASVVQRYLPTVLLMGLIRPLFVAAAHHGRTTATRVTFLFRIVLKLNLFILTPAVVALVLVGDRLMLLASGSRFADAGTTVAGLLLYITLLSTRTCHNLVLVTLEDGRTVLSALVAGLAVFSSAIAIGLVGRTNLLISVLLAGELVAICVMRWAIKRHGGGASLPWISLGKLLVGGVAAWLAGSGVEYIFPATRAGFSDVVGCGIALGVYALLCFLLKPFEQQERQSINRVLPAPIFVW